VVGTVIPPGDALKLPPFMGMHLCVRGVVAVFTGL